MSMSSSGCGGFYNVNVLLEERQKRSVVLGSRHSCEEEVTWSTLSVTGREMHTDESP